jgi:low affinity Fe/Cu permease
MDFDVLISEIEIKIRELMQQNRELKDAVTNFKKENESLGREIIELFKNELMNKDKEIINIKVSKIIEEKGATDQATRHIKKMINRIDKCIAMLKE